MNILYIEKIENFKQKIINLKKILNIDSLCERLDVLEIEINKDNLWDDQERAKNLLTEKSQLQEVVDKFFLLDRSIGDLIDLNQMFSETLDCETGQMIEEEFATLEKQVNLLEIESLFSEEFDESDAFLTINSGAGGTESNDWTQMLLRMYLRWCERKNFKTEIVDKLDGDDAGIKSVTIKIYGRRAYGWLKNENGVHRLVRISPFDSAGKRHTSFSSVFSYPVINQKINIKIEEKDLKIDTYRSSGAGGQHVNKTDSAVRITHLPTGLVFASQTHRSQHANKEEALNRLQSVLYQQQLKQQQDKISNDDSKSLIEWGYQIRSYVLHPYQMVNDLRTGLKSGNTNAVLDGDLDEFIMQNIIKNKSC